MKKKHILLLSMILMGCFEFEKVENLISEYKLPNGQNIRVYSIGTGATTKDRVEIRVRDLKREKIVKKIEGFGHNNKVDIVRINDTLFKIKFTDTLSFKGLFREFNFSIIDR